MSTLANIEDPDEVLHHCLPRQKQSSEKEIEFNMESTTCDPMDHPKFILPNQKVESIGT